MNARRIASLLRELAEAFEQVEPAKKRKAPKLKSPEGEPEKKMSEEARRALRKAGFAA